MNKEITVSLTQEEVRAIKLSMQRTEEKMGKYISWGKRIGWVDAIIRSRDIYVGIRDKMDIALK